MARKWRVNVTTGAPDEARGQDILRRLPENTKPVFLGYGDDLALRIISLSIEAEDDDGARGKARKLVKDACEAAGWDWEPEVRSIDET
jgi:hypothetical protein